MSPEDLLSELSVKIYQPPLSQIRDSGEIGDVSNPLCVLMLLIDFDTEVSMNGIVNFLGNSTGQYATETAAALERIGCLEQAKKLADILAVAAEAGMTHEAIQSDRSTVKPYAVTTFAKLHGQKWVNAVSRIEAIHDDIDMRKVLDSAEQFIVQHRAVVEEALGVNRSHA